MIQTTKRTIITGLINKRKIKLLLTIFAFPVVFAGNCLGQNTDHYNFDVLKSLLSEHKHETPKYSNKSNKPKNEMEFLLASGFNFYKAFFSSQDNPSCVFYPSCSSYSVLAFQQKGFILGTLSTFDRLSRCHHFVKTNQYIYDPSKQRFYDPVY